MVEIIPLREVSASQSVIVHEVSGEPTVVERLVRWGITSAVPVTVVGPGPSPETVIVRLPEASFTLTKEEAETIKVCVGVPDELTE